MKKHGYIGISLIILIFGVFVVSECERRIEKKLVAFEKVPDFSFTNQNGVTISNKNFEGKVYVVEFFFTSCPTICPKMNENMKKIHHSFSIKPNFGIVSISINPENDTPEVLKLYAKKLNADSKNWHFLTGLRNDIYDFSNKGFKMYAAENKNAEGGFEHSGLFALIDKKGLIRSRTIKNGQHENPIKYYDGLDFKQIQWLKEDIEFLLNEN